MTDWVKRGERITVVSFSRVFDYEGEDGWGFAFPCNEQGEALPDQYHDSWSGNWAACITGTVDGRKVVDRGIRRNEHRYWEPGMLRCQCGAEVVIDMLMTNTCERCGRDYNSFGQLLAPREQWGWDTGETLGEILMSDRPLT
jgi:hypothetical protein